MTDRSAGRDRTRTSTEEVQALWGDARHWRLGMIYVCSDDPRVIVRNRFTIGWTWNFGHPWVFPALIGAAGFALTPGILLFSAGILDPSLLIGATAAAVLVLVWIAHRIASGP